MSMWRYLLGFRLVVAVLTAASAVGLVLVRIRDDPTLTEWVIGLSIALHLLILLKTMGDMNEEAQARRRQDQQRLLDGVGGALLLSLNDLAGDDAKFHDWGIHVYRLSDGLLWNRRLPWPKRTQLLRLLRLRITRKPRSTGIIWRRGKGVIGRAMAEDRFWSYPVHLSYSIYRDAPEEWENAGPEINLKLSHSELERCAQYGWVFAHPIRDRSGRVRGVISADLPSGVAENAPWDVDRIRRELRQAAHATSSLWYPPEAREQ